MKKKQDPQIEWGFHAVIPRMIRTGYEKLTPVQKWLYVCLKDLCGEHGTCYRALRVLATETGISIGMLSESIRSLHDAGLIHAEKKRRNTNPTAKEVWHITIVDIWQANAKEHPTKRSQNEHYKEENVHTANNNVHTMNDVEEKRSAGEQQCSHSETEAVSLTSIITEAVSESSIKDASASTRTQSENVHDIEIMRRRKTDPSLQVVKGNNDDTHAHNTPGILDMGIGRGIGSGYQRGETAHSLDSSHSQVEYTKEEEIYDTPTREIPAVQKPGAGGTHFSPADTPPSVSTGDATSRQAPIPVLPKRPRARKPLVIAETQGPPQMPPDTLEWGTRTCLQLFDYWRGAPLLDVGQCKYASACAKQLSLNYSRVQVVLVRTAMNNQKWWIEHGGADVCDVARHMQKELNKLKMPTLARAVNGHQPDSDMVEWQGRWMTVEEADTLGFNGGFGEYK